MLFLNRIVIYVSIFQLFSINLLLVIKQVEDEFVSIFYFSCLFHIVKFSLYLFYVNLTCIFNTALRF